MPLEPIYASRQARAFLRLARYSFILLLALAAPTGASASQTAGKEPALTPGRPVQRRLAGGQSHSYPLTLSAGHFLHVVVEQRGIDVVVKLWGPDGARLVEVDGLNGSQGSEPLYFVATAAGAYRLEVSPLNKAAAEGPYEVRIEELRTATEADARRMKAEALFGEVSQLRASGSIVSLQDAVAKCEEATTLYRALGDARREVLMLNLGGYTYALLGERSKSLDQFTQAEGRARAAADRSGEGVALAGLGLLATFGQTREALPHYAQALKHFDALGDRVNQAGVLNGLGLAHIRLGETKEARAAYERALPIARQVGDVVAEGRSLVGLGGVSLLTGEWQNALDYCTLALDLAKASGDRQVEADALAGLGLAYNNLGDPRKALGYLSQAPALFRAVRDQVGEAVALNRLGEIYGLLSDKQKAREAFATALQVARAASNRSTEAQALNGLGLMHLVAGETQQALNRLEEGLFIAREIGDRPNEAAALTILGQTYSITGETGKAISSLTQAVTISQSLNDRRGEGVALVFLGFAYLRALDPWKAEAAFTGALPLVRSVKDQSAEAQALNGLGLLGIADPKGSTDYLGQALSLGRGAGSRGVQADTHNNTGFARLLSGQTAQALESFKQALQLYRETGDLNGEATSLLNLAWVEAKEDELEEAQAHTAAALDILESLRTRIVNQSLRSTFFSTTQEYYEFYINLLMELHKEEPSRGYDGEALRVSERARARALLDTLAEAKADIRQGVERSLVEREGLLQRRLNEKAEERMRLLAGPHEETQIAATTKEIETLTDELEKARTEIRQRSPGYADLTQPQPLTLREIQTQVLDADTLLLEYSLGKEGSFLWAVTPTSINSYQLPARAEIEAAAGKFYELVSDPPLEPAAGPGISPEALAPGETSDAEAAAHLSRMLLAPAASLLGKKRLLIVGDGTLQYIPFAALPNPVGGAAAAPLIVKHEIVTLPSASSLATLRRESRGRAAATKTLAVLADPVFGRNDRRLEERLKKPGAGGSGNGAPTSLASPGDTPDGLELERLENTGREAEALSKLVPPGQFMVARGFAASRAAATDPGLGQYRYLHFATHGFLDRQHPELSGLALSRFDEQGRRQNSFLRAHEVYNLKFAADLVVLSACQTGRGKDVRGEGMIGLTRGFMYAGAPRVVVSLWNINDEATAELMARFYRGVLVEKMRPAQALQAAQVSFLKEKRWSRPFYWAAFTLQGEWR